MAAFRSKRFLISSWECLLKYRHPSLIKTGLGESLVELEEEDEEEEVEDEGCAGEDRGIGASPSSLATDLRFLYS